MKYMDYDSGYRDGQEDVEIGQEDSMTIAANIELDMKVYKEALEDNIVRYKEGANAAEKSTYRRGYMDGVREKLEELAESACKGCGKPDPDNCDCDPHPEDDEVYQHNEE